MCGVWAYGPWQAPHETLGPAQSGLRVASGRESEWGDGGLGTHQCGWKRLTLVLASQHKATEPPEQRPRTPLSPPQQQCLRREAPGIL